MESMEALASENGHELYIKLSNNTICITELQKMTQNVLHLTENIKSCIMNVVEYKSECNYDTKE